jgi:membrane-bound serine protease (ClpP class)
VFFWSRFLGGTAGWLEVVLFLLGLICIALEIFVIPGFGVFGISGGLLVVASLVLASQTFSNPEPNRDFELMAETVGTLALSIIAVIAVGVAISRFLPHIPVFNQMILTPPGMEDGHYEPQLRPDMVDQLAAALVRHSLVGQRGEAVSMLRPAGKARIGERFVDVVSEGPFIRQGSTVEVIEVAGNRVVVREA